MSPRRIYFDNAATSFPKPPAVAEAMSRYALEIGASAGRGGYTEAVETARLIAQCRSRLNTLFNGEDVNHFVFTLNCTDALNLAIKGLIDPPPTGSAMPHAVCTAIDHNSILRPINALKERGWLTADVVSVNPHTGLVDPDDIRRAIRPTTRLIAVTHGSNVTGTVQPIGQIGRIAREHNIPLIVDAAQTAGHVPIDVQADCIDLLAAPGHKGLLGPLGTGVLYLRPGLEKTLRTLREGGTGSASEHPVQPDFMPDKYEAGSHNAIGLIGLSEGVQWVLNRSVRTIAAHERALCKLFIEGVEGLASNETNSANCLKLFGPRDLNTRVGVFSVRIDGLSPVELSHALERDHGLLTRPGLHCAPHIHETLNTARTGGTTRFSFGAFTTEEEVADAVAGLTEASIQRDGIGVR